MAFDPAAMVATTRRRHAWTDRDAILYALGIGLAGDPLDRTELGYVREPTPTVFPTFPVALAMTGGPMGQIGLDLRYVLHGEQAITLHGAIPPEGAMIAEGRMIGAWDKGPGKGAVFVEEKSLTLEAPGTPLATLRKTVFGRAEGGFGGPRDGQPAPHIVPTRVADLTAVIATAPDQALLYRLSGDLNPIHIDPDAAAQAGHARPILHGLCTFAICARAVIDRQADRRPGRLRHIEARFSAPVYPGDVLAIDQWRDGDTVSFEARVAERGATVIKAGKAIVAAEDWA